MLGIVADFATAVDSARSGDKVRPLGALPLPLSFYLFAIALAGGVYGCGTIWPFIPAAMLFHVFAQYCGPTMIGLLRRAVGKAATKLPDACTRQDGADEPARPCTPRGRGDN